MLGDGDDRVEGLCRESLTLRGDQFARQRSPHQRTCGTLRHQTGGAEFIAIQAKSNHLIEGEALANAQRAAFPRW